MRHNLFEVALHDCADRFGGERAFVQLENCDEEPELDVPFFRTGRFQLRQNFERLLFGFFILVKILLNRRRHRLKELHNSSLRQASNEVTSLFWTVMTFFCYCIKLSITGLQSFTMSLRCECFGRAPPDRGLDSLHQPVDPRL